VGEAGANNTRGQNEKARLRAQPISFPLVHPESRQPESKLERQFFYLSQKRRLRLWLWYLLKMTGLR